MQDPIEQFVTRNHKAGTVTKFETIGYKQYAFFSTEKVEIHKGDEIICLEPWEVAFTDFFKKKYSNVVFKTVSTDCLRKWRVKESGEFERLPIDNGKISI